MRHHAAGNTVLAIIRATAVSTPINGRGYDTSRDASWGNGKHSGGRTTTTGDGRTAGRSTSATNNGDGTASYNSTVTRLNGNTRTVSGTVPRP